MEPPIFLDSWRHLARLSVSVVVGYLVLLALLRLFGKRTIARMNISDFVITVAIGSTLASFIVSKDVPVADGVLALTMLVALQFLVMLATRLPKVRQLVEGDPALPLYDGRLLTRNLAREHVTQSEVRQAVRNEGFGSFGEVGAVVLEVDGSFSVIARSGKDGSLVKHVSDPERE